jgi:hypothetical protein
MPRDWRISTTSSSPSAKRRLRNQREQAILALSRRTIRVHRSTCLTPQDCAEVEGIPCTSVPRTLLDLAATVPKHVLERACDQAERARGLDMRALEELLTRRAGQPGVGRLRGVLHLAAEGVPRSELERRFLALCRRAGLPRPSVNQWMAIGGDEMQCDFVWHGERVVVEVDGWDSHRTRQAFGRSGLRKSQRLARRDDIVDTERQTPRGWGRGGR